MQRDKRGRFIKKANGGMEVPKIITRQNLRYKINPDAEAAYKASNSAISYQDWLMTDAALAYLEPINEGTSPMPIQPAPLTPTVKSSGTLNTPPATTEMSNNTTTPYTPYQSNFKGFSIPGMDLGVQPFKAEPLKLDLNDPLGLKRLKEALTMWDLTGLPKDSMFAPTKIKYDATEDGRFVTADGKELSIFDITNNKNKYELNTSDTLLNGDARKTTEEEKSAGMHLKQIGDPLGDALKNSTKTIDKNKLANFLELARAGIGASVNNKIAERAIAAEKPFLQDVSESHRAIYGDYRAQVQGEKAAAQLRNMASKPLTSDGALQSQMMMDALIKGQQYIDLGNAQDEAMIKQTREVAWQQEKENLQQRQAAAMLNRQAMLMTEKNKALIRNMRDSANFSQVVSPLLAANELRLRNKAAQEEYYLDYYNDATVAQTVWNTFEDGLSDSLKALKNEYLKGGVEGLTKYIGEDTTRSLEWLQLLQIMNSEIIRRKAAIKGAIIHPYTLYGNTSLNKGMDWETKPFGFKQGGTVYKAKLSKRTKDNDRGAKSIETSKKIAARFLEQAIDSLYSYDDVELIAKPKKKRKRKYQAGGGLPFVGFTPVFATSEAGAPKADVKADKTKEDKDDLTSKDVLQLLKDMDGLPSDMLIIVSSLKNFEIQDKMDPLGLSSSSNIASRYISLINKIKVAKFNREEYNNAFNQLKGNGGLNEFAITSEGYLIGTNKDGDFNYFTPDEVNNGVPSKEGYSLLTNSNLLYLRANSLDAAFNHQLTTQAQSGIGMEVVTEQINKIIQGLGSSKESEEGFVLMGQKGQVKEGLKYLQKIAKEVGDNSINLNMSIADYYQAGYLTEDLAQQAEIALQYIFRALPANAKALLQVKGGSSKGAEAIVRSLVTSKTSTDVQFKATPKKMTKSSSSSSSGDGGDVDGLKLSPVQMMQVGYTDHMPVTLQKGTTYATTVNAQVLPITDVNKKLLGITTLDKVAESTFGGALDMNNVTMGSQLIDPQALQNVQIDSTNLYVMNLPIDKSVLDGTIRPDLAWMTKIEEIDKVIRDLGITDIKLINAIYEEAGLPVLMNDNGELNTRDYCKFGVLNGHALNSAFKDLDLLDNSVIEIDDEDLINNIMSIMNKGRGEKDRLDFDSKSWADSIFGTDHDSIYEGTIYIPVRTNAFTGMIGGGQYPDTATAAEVEALVQQKERTRGYVDPGLLNN